jgi:hypothetical protein
MLRIGARVEIINPKSIAHLRAGDQATTGKIVKIDPEYFYLKNLRHKAREEHPWVGVPWASDFPVSMRTIDDDRGFYVLRDDQDNEQHATAYRAAELKFLSLPEEAQDGTELR